MQWALAAEEKLAVGSREDELVSCCTEETKLSLKTRMSSRPGIT